MLSDVPTHKIPFLDFPSALVDCRWFWRFCVIYYLFVSIKVAYFKWINKEVVETTRLIPFYTLLVLESQGPTVQWTTVMRLIVHEEAEVTNCQPAEGTASLTLQKANVIVISIQFCSRSKCVCANTTMIRLKWVHSLPSPWEGEHLVARACIIPLSNWHASRGKLNSICLAL